MKKNKATSDFFIRQILHFSKNDLYNVSSRYKRALILEDGGVWGGSLKG